MNFDWGVVLERFKCCPLRKLRFFSVSGLTVVQFACFRFVLRFSHWSPSSLLLLYQVLSLRGHTYTLDIVWGGVCTKRNQIIDSCGNTFGLTLS